MQYHSIFNHYNTLSGIEMLCSSNTIELKIAHLTLWKIQNKEANIVIPTISRITIGRVSEYMIISPCFPVHKSGGKRVIPNPSPPFTTSGVDFPRAYWDMTAIMGMTGKISPTTTQVMWRYFI